jgi:hypothetical protein
MAAKYPWLSLLKKTQNRRFSERQQQCDFFAFGTVFFLRSKEERAALNLNRRCERSEAIQNSLLLDCFATLATTTWFRFSAKRGGQAISAHPIPPR